MTDEKQSTPTSDLEQGKRVLGIDIGGSGIKGCIVNLDKGDFATERHRIPTPQPCTPKTLVATIKQIIDHFSWNGPVGAGFPGVIQQQKILTAVNLGEGLVDLELGRLIQETTGCAAYVLNDADAAGFAEIAFGAGRGVPGVVLMVTIGTGLGTALFTDGHLLPNTELGHLRVRDKATEKTVDFEWLASDAARKREGLSWEAWAKHFDRFLRHMHRYFWPDLIIIGGGAAKKSDKFFKYLTVPTKVAPAQLENRAGIIGAAAAADAYLSGTA